ncbi:MAG: hypothetical protein QM608_18905 [Caulobacter sp.]
MQLLQMQNFGGQANTTYELLVAGGSMQLTLIDIQPLPAHHAASQRAPFSLIFKSHVQHVLPQAIYRLRSAAQGEVEMFLVPLGRDAQGVTYQAVYN